MAGERTCLVCRTKYDYCPKCGRGSWDKTYMFVCCSENCYNIESVLMKYRSDYNLITKEEAKEKLLNCDLSKIESYPPLIRKDVDEILAYNLENNELITNESSVDIDTKDSKEIETNEEIKKITPKRSRKTSKKKSVSTENISE